MPFFQRFLLGPVLLLPSVAFAAHPLITEGTGTQGQGKFQLELTGERGYDQDESGRTNTTVTTTVLSYGVRENLDTIFTFPVIREATFTEEETTTIAAWVTTGST